MCPYLGQHLYAARLYLAVVLLSCILGRGCTWLFSYFEFGLVIRTLLCTHRSCAAAYGQLLSDRLSAASEGLVAWICFDLSLFGSQLLLLLDKSRSSLPVPHLGKSIRFHSLWSRVLVFWCQLLRADWNCVGKDTKKTNLRLPSK